MTIPLPEPVNFSDVWLPGKDEFNRQHAVWGHTADQLRAYGEAMRAEEQNWWREIAEQLIACHDEPTCPAVTLARERLAAIRKGE